VALCRLNRTVHKRSGKIRSTEKVQYITREGMYAPAATRVKHLDQVPGGARLRDDLIAKGAHNLPAWAEGNAATFFTMAERYERGNGVVSTEWKFALPRELSREDQLAAARDFMASQLGSTHPYVWAMHEPLAHDGQPQPHIHCLWSSRTLDGIERDPAHFFKRYNAKEPGRGGAQKDPVLIAFGQAKRERIAYTDIMNVSLERAGSDIRFHPDTLEARGFEREPEPRVLPSDSNKAKYQGEITENWAKVLAHREGRAVHGEEELAQAWTYWEDRKQHLGLGNLAQLDHESVMARIAEQGRSRERTPRPTHEALIQEQHALEQELHQVEREKHRVHAQIMLEEHRQRRGRQPEVAEDLTRVWEQPLIGNRNSIA
jgi:hypothetical protein